MSFLEMTVQSHESLWTNLKPCVYEFYLLYEHLSQEIEKCIHEVYCSTPKPGALAEFLLC